MLFNSEIFNITLLSLQVSAIATVISLLLGLPLGTWLALSNFRGRSFILSIVNTGLPPVIVGGMLRQLGTAKQIKSTPADETVAAFLHELPQ